MNLPVVLGISPKRLIATTATVAALATLLVVAPSPQGTIPVAAGSDSCVTTDAELLSLVEAKVQRHANDTGRADLHEMFSRSLQTMAAKDSYTTADIKARPDKQGDNWQGLGPNPLWQAVYEELDRLQECRDQPAVAVADNDDPPARTPVVSIAAKHSVREGSAVIFMLTADPAPTSPLTVSVAISQQGDVAFDGQTGTATVTVPTSGVSPWYGILTMDDDIDEPDGSVTFSVQDGADYDVGSSGSVTVPVLDNDPALSISAGPSVTEGGAATFTITASAAPRSPITVSLAVSQNGDYAAASDVGSKQFTFPASDRSATFSVATVDDQTDEPDGSVTVVINYGIDYTVGLPDTDIAAVTIADNDDAPPADDPDQPTLAEAFVASVEELIVQPGIEYSKAQTEPAPEKAVNTTLEASVTSLKATGRTNTSITLQWPTVASADSYYVSLTRRDDLSDKHEATSTNPHAVFTGLETDSDYSVIMIPKRGRDFLFNHMPQPIFASTLPPDGVIYVVDDSGSMDGDFPEVRKALREVQDADGVSKVKVALIAFGTSPKVMFDLTEHEDAPWDSHIDSLGGYKGGTNYSRALQQARIMLKQESLNNKKIVFMSDSQLPVAYFQNVLSQLVSDGIVVDTVFFGEHYGENKGAMEKISTDTGGTHTDVPKPSAGTTNNPAVTARPLEDVVFDLTENQATTLYAFDSTFSLHISGNDHIEDFFKGFARALQKIKVWPTASVLMSRFAGENDLSSSPADAYRLLYNCDVNSRCDGKKTINFISASTNLDNALEKSLATVNSYAKTGDAKRVVLITDGIAANKPTAATLAKYLNDGTCLDVVALGAHADRVYLKSLADTANLCGDFHVAE